jgi:hypothetical protein
MMLAARRTDVYATREKQVGEGRRERDREAEM